MSDMSEPGSSRRASAASPEISLLAGAVIARLQDRAERGPDDRLDQAATALSRAVRGQEFDPVDCARRLRNLPLPDIVLTDHVIPAVARRLGRDWETDRASFAEVSVASARLQSLLGELAPHWSDRLPDAADTALSALLVLTTDEPHTLGPHLVTAQLRRRGVLVRTLYGAGPAEVAAALDQGPRTDMVLFSCAHRRHLAFVAGIMSGLRKLGARRPPAILGGVVLDHETALEKRTGVDLVTNDVQSALTFCRDPRRAETAPPTGRGTKDR
ncbi:cobalamin B12-binding domain-containing protein [Roseivivax isoporae]|uniref:B12-binding domain-containing protein n=1 Tax=Roseivivax isoporae LMG 25204 TaxID=1449351 RepID=X7FA80_9RHOB|nr:hypothetical protein [Roseivivax isoporae]ETX29715.1 hypothetical protein RISW2_22500 [Roseivivax isoporae LMG 25204]